MVLKILKKLSVAVAVTTVGATLVTGEKPANAAAVGYINSCGGNINYLNTYGHTVTNFDNPFGLTLGSLSGLDAVVVASNCSFSESNSIGDVLADFADAGGGVILTEFVFQGLFALGGKIMTADYSPFTIDPVSGNYFINSTLGSITEPGSSLFNGVNTAQVSTNFQANVNLTPGSSLVADWTSGRHAIAYKGLANSSVVGLNLFPSSDYTNSDTGKLVANAINFSLTGASPSTPVPEPGSVVSLLAIGTLGTGSAIKRKQQQKATVKA